MEVILFFCFGFFAKSKYDAFCFRVKSERDAEAARLADIKHWNDCMAKEDIRDAEAAWFYEN